MVKCALPIDAFGSNCPLYIPSKSPNSIMQWMSWRENHGKSRGHIRKAWVFPIKYRSFMWMRSFHHPAKSSRFTSCGICGMVQTSKWHHVWPMCWWNPHCCCLKPTNNYTNDLKDFLSDTFPWDFHFPQELLEVKERLPTSNQLYVAPIRYSVLS